MTTKHLTLRGRRFAPIALAGALLAALVGGTVVSANADAPPECHVAAPTLGQARAGYADSCSLPRIDCDRIDGTWYCSSRVIGRAAPGGVSANEVGASALGPDATPAPPVAPPTTVPPGPPTTAPPATEPPTTPLPPSTAPSTTLAPPTTPPAPTPAPEPTCGVVTIEAEDLALTGAWRTVTDATASGGRYIVWEGLSTARNNSSPADVVSTTIRITQPGSYRFTWAMRQPDGVASDKANDSWLSFPDADRFGPVGGGTYPEFIKVFGNSKGGFAYRATADVNHNKSTIAVEFDQPGTYTLRIAGRSHGHQIDRIVMRHTSISQSDAIAGNGSTCAPPSGNPTTTTTAPPSTTTTSTAPVGGPPATCTANTSGHVDLAKDLISLHYDHAPDRDDGHATAAGKEVATRVGFTPWVIGGAYGADNARTYRDASEPVMDAVWGPGNWINADDDWNAAVQATADRWQQTLDACGDIWIAEGGQSDLSADVVRELRRRQPGLDTESRIHLVQHSNWNEEKALDADLAYVRQATDYIRIPDGNGGGNGTAGLNERNYRGPFLDTALNGANGAGWRAAFDYYSPSDRLDFSDTVELLHILDVGTNEVAGIEDFADRFMR